MHPFLQNKLTMLQASPGLTISSVSVIFFYTCMAIAVPDLKPAVTTECRGLLEMQPPLISGFGNPDRVGVSWLLHSEMQTPFQWYNDMLQSLAFPDFNLSRVYILDLTHPLIG